MSNQPKISIIIGVRNMHDRLEKAIQSVLDQNYSNTELIIMDGGSTDGTIDVIKKYQDHLFYWESKKDKGHPDACNKAIDIATGELIGFLSADDYFEKGLLTKIAEAYQTHPEASVITCGIKIIEEDAPGHFHTLREVTHPDQLTLSFSNMLFEHTLFNARFFKKDIFRRFGKFHATDDNGHVNRSNDREFLLVLAMNKIQSAIIPAALYVYLSHQDASSFSKKNRERIHTEHLLLAEKILGNTALTSEEKNLVKIWEARESVYLFLTYLQLGHFSKLIRSMVDGVRRTHLQWFKEFSLYVLKKLGLFHK